MTTIPAGVDLRVVLGSRPALTAPRVLYMPAPRQPPPGPVSTSGPWRFGAEAEGWGAWAARKWAETTAGLHQLVYGGAVAAGTGVVVPSEVKSPAGASDYLRYAFGELAKANGWPQTEVDRRLASMKAAGTAATVVDTIARLRPLGPDPSWPAAATWYSIADDMSRSAALVSTGEASAKMIEGALTNADEVRSILAEVGAKVDRALSIGENYSKGIGAGIGTVAGIVLVGFLVWLGWPYLAGAAAAKRVAGA